MKQQQQQQRRLFPASSIFFSLLLPIVTIMSLLFRISHGLTTTRSCCRRLLPENRRTRTSTSSSSLSSLVWKKQSLFSTAVPSAVAANTATALQQAAASFVDNENNNNNDTIANDENGSIEDDHHQPQLLHPDQFGLLEYPKSLSPSSILEFKKCPQSFLFQYLYKLKQPTTKALAKGSMCHDALEKLFNLQPEDRSLDNLHNLLRASWGKHRLTDQYKFLFENSKAEQRDIDAERMWGQSALQLLTNYYNIEDPTLVTRPNPMKREFWLHCHLPVDPSLGVTSASANNNNAGQPEETMYIRGIVDRLDMVKTHNSNSNSNNNEVALKIVDYKTGKAPNLKYSNWKNEEIVEENFYQLKVYALLLRENGDREAIQRQQQNLDLRYLRLFYLTSCGQDNANDSDNIGPAKQWDYDLGETQQQRDEVLQDIHQDLSHVWTSIRKLVDLQDPKAFIGCDRKFCYCHKCRGRFVPGSVWEPPT